MLLEMVPQADNGEDDDNAVDVEEGLIKGVADGRPGLEEDEGEANGSNHAPCVRCLNA